MESIRVLWVACTGSAWYQGNIGNGGWWFRFHSEWNEQVRKLTHPCQTRSMNQCYSITRINVTNRTHGIHSNHFERHAVDERKKATLNFMTRRYRVFIIGSPNLSLPPPINDRRSFAMTGGYRKNRWDYSRNPILVTWWKSKTRWPRPCFWSSVCNSQL